MIGDSRGIIPPQAINNALNWMQRLNRKIVTFENCNIQYSPIPIGAQIYFGPTSYKEENGVYKPENYGWGIMKGKISQAYADASNLRVMGTHPLTQSVAFHKYPGATAGLFLYPEVHNYLGAVPVMATVDPDGVPEQNELPELDPDDIFVEWMRGDLCYYEALERGAALSFINAPPPHVRDVIVPDCARIFELIDYWDSTRFFRGALVEMEFPLFSNIIGGWPTVEARIDIKMLPVGLPDLLKRLPDGSEILMAKTKFTLLEYNEFEFSVEYDYTQDGRVLVGSSVYDTDSNSDIPIILLGVKPANGALEVTNPRYRFTVDFIAEIGKFPASSATFPRTAVLDTSRLFNILLDKRKDGYLGYVLVLLPRKIQLGNDFSIMSLRNFIGEICLSTPRPTMKYFSGLGWLQDGYHYTDAWCEGCVCDFMIEESYIEFKLPDSELKRCVVYNNIITGIGV